MNKRDIAIRYAEQTGVSTTESEEVIRKVLQIFADGLVEDGRVVVSNFGVFDIAEVKGRTYSMPSGETTITEGHRKIRFRPAANLEAYVEGKKVPIAIGLPRGRS